MQPGMPGRSAWRARTWVRSWPCSAVLVGCGGGNEGSAQREAAPGGAQHHRRQRQPRRDDARRLRSDASLLCRRVHESSSAAARATSSVTMALPVPKPGYYELFNWLPQTGPDCGRADATIHHAQGRTQRRARPMHRAAANGCRWACSSSPAIRARWCSTGSAARGWSSTRYACNGWVNSVQRWSCSPGTLSVGMKDQRLPRRRSTSRWPAAFRIPRQCRHLAGRHHAGPGRAGAGRPGRDVGPLQPSRSPCAMPPAPPPAREFELIIADSAADEPVDSAATAVARREGS